MRDMKSREVCPCPYCDPLLWTQAQTATGTLKAAKIIGLLAELVEYAIHPSNRPEREPSHE